MTKFEKELLKFRVESLQTVNADDFVLRLNNRVKNSDKRRQIILTSFLILLVIGFSTFTQLGVPLKDKDIYFTDDASGVFETDFSYIDNDSLSINEGYMDDIAYFLLQEGDFWNTVEFLNTLEQETNL